MNLNQTGLYLYATYTSKQECLVKVGMAKDQTIEKRIKKHVSSAGGLELFGAIAIQKGRVKSAEDKLKEIMKAEFGEAYSGTETFLVPSSEYVLELLETSEFRRQIETTFEYKESKIVDYKYASLDGAEEDIRDTRQPDYFDSTRIANPTTKTGLNEKPREVMVDLSSSGIKLKEFIKAKLGRISWIIWRTAQRSMAYKMIQMGPGIEREKYLKKFKFDNLDSENNNATLFKEEPITLEQFEDVA